MNRPSIINRSPQPIVVRHPKEPAPRLFVVLLIFALIWGFGFGSLAKHGAFAVESVLAQQIPARSGAVWVVTGAVVNQTSETRDTPQLRVRLLRKDDSVAAERLVPLDMPSLSAHEQGRFTVRLLTPDGEALRADVVPVESP